VFISAGIKPLVSLLVKSRTGIDSWDGSDFERIKMKTTEATFRHESEHWYFKRPDAACRHG
jgi:hypothetical protein